MSKTAAKAVIRTLVRIYEWRGLSGIVSIAFFPFILYNTFVDFALFFGKTGRIFAKLHENTVKRRT